MRWWKLNAGFESGESLPSRPLAATITSDITEEENGLLLPSLHQHWTVLGQPQTARPESASPNDQGGGWQRCDRANQRPILMSRSKSTGNAPANDSSANLGFEAKLWLAADKLRNNMDAGEYKHVVLGLRCLPAL